MCCPESVISEPAHRVESRRRWPQPVPSRSVSKNKMGSVLDTPDRSTTVFTKRLVRSDGSQVRYLEAGHGEPVVVLARGDDPSSMPLSNVLADHFHVLVFDISHLAPPASNEQSLLSR